MIAIVITLLFLCDIDYHDCNQTTNSTRLPNVANNSLAEVWSAQTTTNVINTSDLESPTIDMKRYKEAKSILHIISTIFITSSGLVLISLIIYSFTCEKDDIDTTSTHGMHSVDSNKSLDVMKHNDNVKQVM